MLGSVGRDELKAPGMGRHTRTLPNTSGGLALFSPPPVASRDGDRGPPPNAGVNGIALLRSIAKSLTWRAIGLVLLGGLAWAITGDLLESMWVTIAFNGVRVFLYVGHEELWERWRPLARVGRGPLPDREPAGGRHAVGVGSHAVPAPLTGHDPGDGS